MRPVLLPRGLTMAAAICIACKHAAWSGAGNAKESAALCLAAGFGFGRWHVGYELRAVLRGPHWVVHKACYALVVAEWRSNRLSSVTRPASAIAQHWD